MLNRRQQKNLKSAIILGALSFFLALGLVSLFLVAGLTVLTTGVALFNPVGGCLVAFVSVFAASVFGAHMFVETLEHCY